ncbi:hypothetical protein [Leuconostoc rapi]|uniref:hypothetical protein n=1 Tax=Leuconostoc rapi TaxID=1406906 RepID=UPI00195A5071|nr:hypothetical protein [Leuconostoc rapi]MBM7434863.1 cytoskeletal protein RodZ [Leuconostoc rapi]
MQRKPFKKSHRARNIVIAVLVVILVVFTIFAIVGHNQQSAHKNEQGKSTVTSKTKHAKSKITQSKSSSSTTSASESTSVAEAPVTASSAVSSAISIVTNDATQTPITDNTTVESSASTPSSHTNSEATSSSQIQQPDSSSSSASPASFGNWSASTYNAVAIGTVTYDEVRATYGNPTYLTASDQVYAIWQSTSGAKVSIVFTPTGDANNLKLVASSKSQSGLQ